VVNQGVTSATPSAPIQATNSSPSSDPLAQWRSQVQPPIEFYGLVVDENNQPVEGANAEMIWSTFQPEASFKTNKLTRADGLFSLQDVSGGQLEVNISKPGCYSLKKGNENFFNYITLPGYVPFHPDRAQPVVFHLKRKGGGVELITSRQNREPWFPVSLPRDGRPVQVDLVARKIATNGTLELSQVKPELEKVRGATEWSFELAIPDGGLIEQNDELPFLAPEEGYAPEAVYRFKKTETNWSSEIKKSYYIRFGNPVRYGWLTVETSISTGGVYLTYAINPNGERNLEPKQ
jgi:hypothetical protein